MNKHPFAPGVIAGPSATPSPSGLALVRRMLRRVLWLGLALLAITLAYCVAWWPEIWADAQAKHAAKQMHHQAVMCGVEYGDDV